MDNFCPYFKNNLHTNAPYLQNKFNNMYFLLRFGFANAINDCLRLEICVVCGGNFWA